MVLGSSQWCQECVWAKEGCNGRVSTEIVVEIEPDFAMRKGDWKEHRKAVKRWQLRTTAAACQIDYSDTQEVLQASFLVFP